MEPFRPAVLLRTLRGRWVWQRALEYAGSGLLAMAGALVAWSAVAYWRGGAGLSASGLVTALLIGGGLGVAVAWSRRPKLPTFARWIDGAGQTRDRFTTALALREGQPSSAGIQALALAECEAYLAKRDFTPLLPWRLPWALPWLLVPALALALLQWAGAQRGARVARATAEARAEVAPTVEKLRALAKEWQPEASSPEQQQQAALAKELLAHAEKLEREAHDPTMAKESALRELSALEAKLQEMQQELTAGRLSTQEQKDLAAAMQQEEATKEVGQALAQQGPEAAAKALEQAANQEGQSAAKANAAAKVEEGLRRAMQRMGQQQASANASAAMKKLAQAAQQGGSALQQELAKQLQNQQQGGKAGKSGQGDKGGKQMSEQELQQLLTNLQNMKPGAGGNDAGEGTPMSAGEGPSGGTPPDGQMFSEGAAAAIAQGNTPSGNPGSERDTGTTETPFGEKNAPAAERPGRQARVEARQNEKGEVVSQTLTGGAEATKAQQRYRALYEAMAPAAEDAIVSEEIPLGSRLLIRRYFESIRPRQ